MALQHQDAAAAAMRGLAVAGLHRKHVESKHVALLAVTATSVAVPLYENKRPVLVRFFCEAANSYTFVNLDGGAARSPIGNAAGTEQVFSGDVIPITTQDAISVLAYQAGAVILTWYWV